MIRGRPPFLFCKPVLRSRLRYSFSLVVGPFEKSFTTEAQRTRSRHRKLELSLSLCHLRCSLCLCGEFPCAHFETGPLLKPLSPLKSDQGWQAVRVLYFLRPPFLPAPLAEPFFEPFADPFVPPFACLLAFAAALVALPATRLAALVVCEVSFRACFAPLATVFRTDDCWLRLLPPRRGRISSAADGLTFSAHSAAVSRAVSVRLAARSTTSPVMRDVCSSACSATLRGVLNRLLLSRFRFSAMWLPPVELV